jgi:hypothetical protein
LVVEQWNTKSSALRTAERPQIDELVMMVLVVIATLIVLGGEHCRYCQRSE